MEDVLSPLVWKRGTLYVLDQAALPAEATWRPCRTLDDVVRVIVEGRVRGAAAVACAAGYAVALHARAGLAAGIVEAQLLRRTVEEAVEAVRRAAPGAVQTFWALAQVRDAGRVSVETADAAMVTDAIEARACAIQAEDIARCQRIGAAGAELVPDGATVITFGSHGALSSGGFGTALGVLRAAVRARRRARVLVCESRPAQDGARIAAWELAKDGMDVTVIPDGAAAGVLARREAQLLLLGAERISAGGDIVTDLGSYGAALAAAAAGVPLLVAAAASCIDPAAPLAVDDAPWRDSTPPVPERVALRAPAADVVPGALVGAIVTEHGVHRAPWPTSLRL